MAQVFQRNFFKIICFTHAGEQIQWNNMGWALKAGLGNLVILTLAVLVQPKS